MFKKYRIEYDPVYGKYFLQERVFLIWWSLRAFTFEDEALHALEKINTNPRKTYY